jgi:hypothetical protein
MSKVLIIGNTNYADEFDLDFFHVVEADEWEEIKKITAKYFEKVGDTEQEVYFGTNEQIIFCGYNDWLRSFKVKELSDEEAATLKKLFECGEYGFGTGSGVIDFALERIGELDEEDEEEIEEKGEID